MDWFLKDYVGDLDHRLDHLPVPLQSIPMTKKLGLLFKQVIPSLAPAIPNPVPSSHPYKLPPLPSPGGKVWADLQGSALPLPNLPHTITIPHTPLRPGAVAIMTAAHTPGAIPKMTAITLRCL